MSSNFGFISKTFPEIQAHDPDAESISAKVPLNSIIENGRLKNALKFGMVLNANDRSTNNSYWGYEGSGMPANLNYFERASDDGSPPPAGINAPNFTEILSLEEARDSDSTFQNLASPYMPNLVPPDIHSPLNMRGEFSEVMEFILPEGARSRDSTGAPVENFREDINGDKTSPHVTSEMVRVLFKPIPPVDRVTTQSGHP